MNKVEHFRVASAPFKTRYDNFIGGKFVAPNAGRYFENTSPVTGQVLCEIARSDASDIEAALDAAHAAKDKWGQTSPGDRARALNKIAYRMEERQELLAGRGGVGLDGAALLGDHGLVRQHRQPAEHPVDDLGEGLEVGARDGEAPEAVDDRGDRGEKVDEAAKKVQRNPLIR